MTTVPGWLLPTITLQHLPERSHFFRGFINPERNKQGDPISTYINYAHNIITDLVLSSGFAGRVAIVRTESSTIVKTFHMPDFSHMTTGTPRVVTHRRSL